MKKLSILFCIYSTLSLSGCLGTIFTGSSRNIALITSNGKQVKVEVTSGSGFQETVAPNMIAVQASSTPVNIRVKDSCYESTSTILAPKHNIISIADFLFGFIGTTGYSVDTSTGAAWTYDESVMIMATPKDSCDKK